MRRMMTVLVMVAIFSMLATHVLADKEILEVDLNLEEQDLAYTFFELSNGESTLIQSGKGQTILIDTGSLESQEELEERLEMFHVDLIDTVIITNPTDEYTGNLQWIINNFQVKTIIVSEVIKEQLISFHHLNDKEVIGWKKGDKTELIPFLKTEVFYVEERNLDDKGALVTLFSYGKQKLLFMGIADAQVEKELVESYPLKSTILKVADFGSEKGTTQRFLEEVDPQVAILFKKIGTPVSELVIERLQETWIDIYQTNRLGTVSIKCHNDDYEILTVRSQEEEFSFSLSNNISKLLKK
ncbi:MBL fold metallo-hydrolase [Bacillaceae bacterium IKA-2]|nr:MBL fold metallo-hydrolase [Bacillaceae bacterium IKA-2]